MKFSQIRWLFFTGILLISAANAASFLTPTKFPTTASDYTFTQRIENKTDGYEPYAGLSTYQILKFESMEDYAHQAIISAQQSAGISTCDGCAPDGTPPPQDGTTITPTPTPPTQTASAPIPSSSGELNGYCARRNPNIPTGQQIPFGLPVNTDDLPANITERSQRIAKNTNNGLFCSPYGCARKRPHEGIDIGCTADFYQMPIYATADGVVEHITRAGNNASAGNYIRINHGGGWITQYMHLDQMFVTTGQRVSAGCLIGLMGHTGGNRDQKVRNMGVDLTHLHYEILYSGRASYVTAPNGARIPIVRGDSELGPCGNFKAKIYPNKIMVYK